MGRLQDKVVLITGASSGLGRSIALVCAREGCKLVVCADLREESNVVTVEREKISEEARSDGEDCTREAALETAEGALKETASLIPASEILEAEKIIEKPDEELKPTDKMINSLFGDEKAVFVKCDVTIEEEVQSAVFKAVELGGRLDVMINNAGTGSDGCLLHDMESETFEKIMKLNAQGPFHGCKAALSQFLKQDLNCAGHKGRILNISSAAGLAGVRYSAAYSASKAAVIGMTRALAVDYAAYKVHVNALCPGFFKTAMTQHLFENELAAGYMQSATPYWNEGNNIQDVTNAAIFLASDDATWVTGAVLPVDGGLVAM